MQCTVLRTHIIVADPYLEIISKSQKPEYNQIFLKMVSIERLEKNETFCRVNWSSCSLYSFPISHNLKTVACKTKMKSKSFNLPNALQLIELKISSVS